MALFAIRLFCLGLVIFSLGACSQVPIHKRSALAKPEMNWIPDPADAAIENHVYFSKEGSSGGVGVANSGCGCN